MNLPSSWNRISCFTCNYKKKKEHFIITILTRTKPVSQTSFWQINLLGKYAVLCVCVRVCVRACVHACVHARARVCVCVYTCIYI